MRVRRIGTWVALVAIIGAMGCAAATQGGSPKRDRNVLTRDEIAGAGVSNLYDAISRLRPAWLQVRGQMLGNNPEILVYEGQSLLGGVDELRRLQPREAYEIHYLDRTTTEATMPGTIGKNVAAAIVIQTAPTGH